MTTKVNQSHLINVVISISKVALRLSSKLKMVLYGITYISFTKLNRSIIFCENILIFSIAYICFFSLYYNLFLVTWHTCMHTRTHTHTPSSSSSSSIYVKTGQSGYVFRFPYPCDERMIQIQHYL